MTFKNLFFSAILLSLMSCDLSTLKLGKDIISSSLSSDKKEELKQGLYTIKYDNSNRIRAKINYTNGVKDGLAKEYYKSGNIKQEINYVMGRKEGVTKTYHTDGPLYKESFYKDNVVTQRKYYYKDGTLKSDALYSDGKPTTYLKEYYKSGKLKTKYPKINIKTIDQTASKDQFRLEVSLSEKRKGVKFYIIFDPKTKVESINLNKYELRAIPMEGKMGVLEIPVKKNTHIKSTVGIYASYSTINGRKKIDKLDYDLFLKNY